MVRYSDIWRWSAVRGWLAGGERPRVSRAHLSGSEAAAGPAMAAPGVLRWAALTHDAVGLVSG